LKQRDATILVLIAIGIGALGAYVAIVRAAAPKVLRVDANQRLTQLRVRYDSEVRKEPWAAATEREIAQLVERHIGDRFKLLGVQCKETICAVALKSLSAKIRHPPIIPISLRSFGVATGVDEWSIFLSSEPGRRGLSQEEQ
jgi:hypothetical protein